MGKPFFLSGGVLLHTLESGMLYGSELSDVTNGVIQGAGFLLRDYQKTKNLVNSLNTIDKVCREVENTLMPQEFLRLIDEVSMKFEQSHSESEGLEKGCLARLGVRTLKYAVSEELIFSPKKMTSKYAPCSLHLSLTYYLL